MNIFENMSKKKKYSILFLIFSFAKLLFMMIEICLYKILTILFPSFLSYIIIFVLHYFLLRAIIQRIIFPGQSFIYNRVTSLNLGLSTAKNFSNQISELKRVITDFVNKERNKPMSIIDLDSRLFILKNAMDSIVSYLRISNSINQTHQLSPSQKLLTLNLFLLKQNIEESRIVRIIETSIREAENGEPSEIRNGNLDGQIKKIILSIEKVEENLNDFLLKGGIYRKLKNWLFNDTFGSLYQLKAELMNRFNCETVVISTENKILLDGLLIKPEESSNKAKSKPGSKRNSNENVISILENSTDSEKLGPSEKTVMIICGPNAVAYEVLAYSDTWIEYYLQYGMSVLLWNYRGFGLSQGSSDFNNMRSDSECIYDLLKNKYKFSKIGVHGISIGGIPASYLAEKNLVNLCFVDRSFGSLNSTIKSYKFGAILSIFYNLLFFPSSDNTRSFTKSEVIKIVSGDPNDSIVSDTSSLKTTVALYYFKNLFKKDNITQILESKWNMFSVNLAKLIENINGSNSQKISQELPSSTNIKYDKLVEETAKEFDIVVTEENSSRVRDQSRVLQSLKSIFEKFDAAGETLLNYSNKKNLIFFEIFFTNLFIWGSFKIGTGIASDRTISYRAVSKKLAILNQKLSRIINHPDKYEIKDRDLKKSMSIVLESLLKLEEEYKNRIFKNELTESVLESSRIRESVLLETNDNLSPENMKRAELSEEVVKMNRGELIPLKCGHNGSFSFRELELYSLHLLNSKFID